MAEAEKDPRCWCGGQRGPRVPADADGWGCLDDINHERLDEKDALIVALAKVVAFYAEPETYNAIFIVPDRPAGEFADDFSEDHGDPFYERPMPGAKARAVLKEHAEVLLSLLPIVLLPRDEPEPEKVDEVKQAAWEDATWD
jgi:hypothetical protein